MGKHVLKLYGISIVGILVALIPLLIVYFLAFLLGGVMFGLDDATQINIFNIESNGTYLVKYIVFQLICTALVGTVMAFFQGGIYGTAVQAVFEGYTTVGNFFSWGARTYGKMYAFTFLNSLLWMLYTIMASILYSMAITTGMTENGTSLIIDIFLFIVFLMLIIISFCSPVPLIKENAGVFRSMILPFKTFGKSLLSAIFFILVFLGVTIAYFLPGIIIVGITDLSMGHMDMNNVVSDALMGIIILLYYIFVLPFAYCLAVLITVNRYKNKIRPVLYGDSSAPHPFIQPSVQPSVQPPVQPTEPEQLNFTFQFPDSDSKEQTKQDADEDTSRFTF